LIYEDNFDYFDSSKWFIEVVSNPHNNELQYYTDRTDNIRVEDGHLVISPLKENYGGKQYTSGRIHSNFAWKYGRVEVRAKSPNGYGLWPAIWMMPRDSVYGGWPESGEIDIMEARGQDLHQFGSTIHYGICCDNHYWESSGDMQLQCSIDQYHVYTLDWTPTELVYSLDGKPYYSQSLDRVISWMYNAPGQPFDQYFYMILNVAVGGDYLDNPKPSTVWNYPDAEMWVDYVRVYSVE
uniref:GH16 domain-containing protein n=1 Tax=Ciona intestinalis TaxID=7719 RepID=F7B0D1_CIOIN